MTSDLLHVFKVNESKVKVTPSCTGQNFSKLPITQREIVRFHSNLLRYRMYHKCSRSRGSKSRSQSDKRNTSI